MIVVHSYKFKFLLNLGILNFFIIGYKYYSFKQALYYNKKLIRLLQLLIESFSLII